MARPFFEETVLTCARMGSSYAERYEVEEHQTSSGDTYAHLLHPYPIFSMTIDLANVLRPEYRENVVSLYHKCQGTFAGFRYRHAQDYSTNSYVDEPTATDQICLPTATPGLFQIVRWYGTQGDTTQSHRRIRKPKPGTVLVSIGGRQVVNDWSVSSTTGLITFTDNDGVITSITQQEQAVVTVGANDYEVGDWVYIDSAAGMIQINGGRYEVVARDSTTITIDLDTTGFDPYDSGGETHTAPQGSEIVRAGCHFDIPVHFMAELSADYNNANVLSSSFMIEEILNP